MEAPLDSSRQPESFIDSPIPPDERKPPDEYVYADAETVFVIPRVLLNYVVIGVVMLALGGVVGYQIALVNVGTTEFLIAEAVEQALDARGDSGETTAAETAQLTPFEQYQVSADDDPAIGPEDAPVTIIEFSDFKCPYCSRFHQETFSRILADYEGKIRFVYRDYPILGPQSLDAAYASECADDQGVYWQYHDLMFANQQDLSRDGLIALAEQADMDMDTFTDCLDKQVHRDEIIADYTAGYQLGITGTPAFFINGRYVSGAQPYTVFAGLIEEELKAAEDGSADTAS